MSQIRQRNSKPLIWAVPIAMGILCIFAALFISVYFKNFFIARHQLLNPPAEDFNTINEIREVENKIFLLKGSIGSEKSLSDIENSFSGSSNQTRIDSARKKEEQLAQLLVKKEELLKRKEENRGKPTGKWYQDNNIGDLFDAPLYFGLITGFLIYVTFLMKCSERQKGLTCFEIRSIAFLPTAIAASIWFWFIYLWYISISY